MRVQQRSRVAAIAEQIGSELMPDNAVWRNRFTVASASSSSVYTVAQRHTDGVWGCSCPGWRHHRKCKHLTDILSRLAALPVPAREMDPEVAAMLLSARTAHLDLDGCRAVRAPRMSGRMVDL